MAIVKATFLLRVKDNDGRDLLPEIRIARRGLWSRFNAYTNEVEGVYMMADGSEANDVHKKITLIIDDARLRDLEEVLREFKAKTTQESIYLELLHSVELRLV
jgi:hypothetical protein